MIEQQIVLRAYSNRLSHFSEVGLEVSVINARIPAVPVRRKEACQHIDGCGFTGTVVTQERKNLTLVKVEAQTIDGLESTEAFFHVFHTHSRLPNHGRVGSLSGIRCTVNFLRSQLPWNDRIQILKILTLR